MILMNLDRVIRSSDRIESFLNEFKKVWLKHPDLRFGQILSIVLGISPNLNGEKYDSLIDPFYIEEDDFIKLLHKKFNVS